MPHCRSVPDEWLFFHILLVVLRCTHRVRSGFLRRVSLFVRLWSHLEDEVTATDDIAVGDVVLQKGLAIELGALDIDVLGAVVACLDDELLTVLEGDGGFAEEGTADDVLVGAGGDGVESKGREDIPP